VKTYRDKKHGFEIDLPEEWFLCTKPPSLIPTIMVAIAHGQVPRTDVEFSTGPNEYLNIVVEKMIPEPSPETIEHSFKLYARQMGFADCAYGRIFVEQREHPWARYRMQDEVWLKKYMIVLERKGYAITASCVGTEMFFQRGKIWNQIAESFRLVAPTDNR
jgi:hypothetical protein